MVSFANPLGLLALATVGVLIILYLFYKRPVKKLFPSIMFFLKDMKMTKKSFAWRRFASNLLFILQLIAILLAALAIADPFQAFASLASEDHVVLVIDSSASMQTKHEGSTRFDKAVDEAVQLIQGRQKVSIILAEDLPLLLLEEGTAQQAEDALKKIEGAETPTNLGDAMLQALSFSGGAVHVFSDFSSFGETDPVIAQQQLQAAGMPVTYHEVFSPAKNVGIIDASVKGNTATLKVKNYESNGVSFSIQSNTTTKNVVLDKGAVQEVRIQLLPGENVVSLSLNDDLAVDNTAYFVLPDRKRIKTLYITNKENFYIGFAYTSCKCY